MITRRNLFGVLAGSVVVGTAAARSRVRSPSPKITVLSETYRYGGGVQK